MKQSTRIAAVLALAFALSGASALAAPQHVHLSWQGPTDTTMSVTWRSSESTGVVQYGVGSATQTQTAVSTPYQGSYLHVAELTGLTPGTTYQYRAGAEGSWSPDYTFATAPRHAARTSFRFAAWGDSRDDDAARRGVREQVQARTPAFSILTADLVADGRVQSLWDEWFASEEPLTAVSPIMTTLGNHEAYADNYFAQFTHPTHDPAGTLDPEAYYSFDYGNVHFVSLSTEPGAELEVGDAQYQWLEQDLSKASSDPNVRWIVAYAHRPPYTSGSHGDTVQVQQTWVPLFEKYGVDLTFWGHDHHYERSKPLVGGQVVDQGGVVYVITGGAGAPLYSVTGNQRAAFTKSTHHFVEVNVTATELKLEARGLDGQVFDALTLTKSGDLPPEAAGDLPPSVDDILGGGTAGGDAPQDTTVGEKPASCGSSAVGAMGAPLMGLLGIVLVRRRRD